MSKQTDTVSGQLVLLKAVDIGPYYKMVKLSACQESSPPKPAASLAGFCVHFVLVSISSVCISFSRLSSLHWTYSYTTQQLTVYKKCINFSPLTPAFNQNQLSFILIA